VTTEEYSSGTWGAGGDTNKWMLEGAGIVGGTSSSSLIFNGNNEGSYDGITESYNGSTWTNQNVCNTKQRMNAGLGTSSTSAITCGGENTTNVSEEYAEAAGPTGIAGVGGVSAASIGSLCSLDWANVASVSGVS